MAEAIVTLYEFEAKAAIPLEPRAPGVYTQQLQVRGGSVRSSVYVKSIDPGAVLIVDYYDFTTGLEYGEENFLAAHDPISVASTSDSRILVPDLHDKLVVRASLIGGSAEFSVYTGVVNQTATDIDNALQREGDPTSLSKDKGIPIVVRDPVSNVWRFATGFEGIQDVRIVGNVAVGEPGLAFFLDYNGATTPGIEKELISYTVPTGNKFNLLQVALTCAFETRLMIYANGSLIGTARTTPASAHVIFSYRIARALESGTLLSIKAITRDGSPIDGIECYVQGTLSGS